MRLVIGLADHESGRQLLSYAVLLNRDLDVEVRVIHVVDRRVGYLSRSNHYASELVRDAVEWLRHRGVDATGAVFDRPVLRVSDALLAEAERWHGEMIVLYGKRRYGWISVFCEDVAKQVMRRSYIPTTLVGPFQTATMTRSRVEPDPKDGIHLWP